MQIKIIFSSMEYNSKKSVIAIDGYSASGKSTLAKKLSEKLRFEYLDTGILYRFLAKKILDTNIEFTDEKKVCKLIDKIDININIDRSLVSNEKIANIASIISAFPNVRKRLTNIKRNFTIGKKGVILDGRDIGSVVFPDAKVKIFMTAFFKERAKRRYKQLQKTRKSVRYQDILGAIKQRDSRDVSRDISPLVVPEDAILVDSTFLNIEDIVDSLIPIISVAFCLNSVINKK